MVKAGKTADEGLNKWIEMHPDDIHISEDSVRESVKRIDKS